MFILLLRLLSTDLFKNINSVQTHLNEFSRLRLRQVELVSSAVWYSQERFFSCAEVGLYPTCEYIQSLQEQRLG